MIQGSRVVTELIKESIPFEDATENLFDIQIKEIDAELEKFNENPARKGNRVMLLMRG